MKGKIPDRWEAYTSMGRQIPGTRFISFKVPLKEEIMQKASNQGIEWFCPRTLMDHCLNLGLVVDLTYTDKYYNPQVFISQGIQHTKIFTEGKVIPKPKVVKQFFKIVNDFLDENKENEKLIGVHCTHGLNRTGYLICRYMIEHLGIAPDLAISDFNSARGHEQERKIYLDHLRQMKWQQEPAIASDSEEESRKTPGQDNRRRSKRNFDAMRDEDEVDGSWPTGPARKWARTPRTERKYYGQNYNSSTPSPSYNRRDSSEFQRHKVKTSPYGAQRYYDSRYRGRVAPQYDPNFYQQQGSGVGPSRQSPRWSKNVHWDNSSYGRPRQYRGPRQYETPPQRERETLDQEPRDYRTNSEYERETWNQSYDNPIPVVSNGTPETGGPRRNPFSPGASGNIFSPGTPHNTRRYGRQSSYYK